MIKMVTTSLDFIHWFRYTTGVARSLKKVARQASSLEYANDELSSKLIKFIDQGLISEVEETFNKILRNDKKEDEFLKSTSKKELTIFYDELKEERKAINIDKDLEKEINKIIDKTHSGLKGKIDSIKKILDDIDKKIGIDGGKITNVINQIMNRDYSLIETKNLRDHMVDKSKLFIKIKNYAIQEKREIKEEEVIIKIFHNTLKEIFGIIKSINNENKDQKISEIESKLNGLSGQLNNFANAMETEANLILESMNDVALIYIDLIERVKDKISRQLYILSEQDYPPYILEKIKKEEESIYGEIMDNLKTVFKLAYYDQRKSR